MDPTLRPSLTSQPPPSTSSSYTSFPILVITILGILTTAILLLCYYVFAIKCRLNLHRADLLRRLYFARSRRHQFHMPPIVSTTTAPESRGLDPSTIRSIPIIKFTKAAAAAADRRTSFNECVVCLNEFQEEEKLRLLPSCSHAFHIDCIDIWLQFNANCPLCRSDITSPIPIPAEQFTVLQPPDQELNGSIVIEVRGDESGAQTPRMEAPNPSPRSGHGKTKGRKLHKMGSMGDECINVRGKDEQFCVQPIRRSFSMDSSNDRQLYLSVQELLRHNPHCFDQEAGGSTGEEEASSSSSGGGGGGCGRVRRSFFSFGYRSSRTAILPFHIDQ